MNKSYLLLVFFVALASVHAAHYYVIVGASAPATDVVIAANFAASMKGSLGITFESYLDTDAYATFTNTDLQNNVFVLIDGNNRSVRVSNAGEVTTAVKNYFAQQSFTTVPLLTREDLLLKPQNTVAPTPVAPPAVPKKLDVRPAEMPPEQDNNETEPVSPPVTAPVTQPPVAPVTPPPKPNVIMRVFRWIASLF